MACGSCGSGGGGDRWMKTCLSAEGEKVSLCDPCWEELELVIVAGDTVVTARCDRCGRYGNPRAFREVHPGGRKHAYGGVCNSCVEGS